MKFTLYLICLYQIGTQNNKVMLVISSREFRQNQKKYFERVDKGEHIIVQRAKDKAYALTPISEEDMYFSAGMVDKIKQSVLEVEKGEVSRVSTSKGISDLLGL
jgi:antitoxin YefM